MTAISTKVSRTSYHTFEGPPRLAYANYSEMQLRGEQGEDVRKMEQVLTEHYGPEDSGWEFQLVDVAERIGHVLIHPDGDAYRISKPIR